MPVAPLLVQVARFHGGLWLDAAHVATAAAATAALHTHRSCDMTTHDNNHTHGSTNTARLGMASPTRASFAS